jgi:hypothetical protein
MPGPQHNLPVAVLDETGRQVATATCFFATFEEDGAPGWRGFLTFIDPAGSLAPGRFRLHSSGGDAFEIQVREIRSGEKREQAIFGGIGRPPPVPETPGS